MSDRNRRLAAKRVNEHLKLTAAGLNGAAVATLAAAFIIPAISSVADAHPNWIPVAVILHLGGHAALSLLKSEE